MTSQYNADMPIEEFREAGHHLIDWIAGYLDQIRDFPVMSLAGPGVLYDRLAPRFPHVGQPIGDIMSDFEEIILPGITHWNHPSFAAYFNSSGSGPGILGELLTAALNVNAMVWRSSPAATELEQISTDWLKEMMRLPRDLFGIIFEGGSTSTFHALAAAREAAIADIRTRGLAGRSDVPRMRVYASEEAHSSVEKTAILLGLGIESIRRITVDDQYRMIPQKLGEAITDDRRKGVLPLSVVATVGTTSCTSLDPVCEIADICESEGVWLHVDAAHGGAAGIVPEMRHVLAGCDRADSIVINPHKWLFVPLDLSVLFIRRSDVLRSAFSVVPEYLRSPDGEDAVDFMDYGIPLGRRFRALKLWFVLQYFGERGLAERIRHHRQLALWFSSQVNSDPEFERLAPVPLTTTCFRAAPSTISECALNEFNENLLTRVNATGRAFLSHTKLDGKFTLRMVISHLRTTASDVGDIWDTIVTEKETLKRELLGTRAE